MPIQELERAGPLTFKQYDILSQPSAGGRQEPVNPFKGTIIIAQPVNRNLPPPESQKATFSTTGLIDFNKDLKRIEALHALFGMQTDQRLSHDPAVDRARYERAQADAERQLVKQGVITDMERNLYERAHASQSTVVYYQDDQGRIYNPNFPGESFDVVLQRGLEYSKRQGFVDYEREMKEFNGWKEIMLILFNSQTPIDTKELVISGPGLKKDTSFTDNFVDIYTKAIDPATGKVIVVMTRFASGVDYSKYKEIARHLRSDYFNGEQLQPGGEDMYFLEHPILINSDSKTAQQIFYEEFSAQKGAIEEEETKNYLSKCGLLILAYAESICADFLNPEQVRKTFKAVLNKFDDLRGNITKVAKNITEGAIRFGKGMIHQVSALVSQAKNSFRNLQEEIDHYGSLPVKPMMVGCGLSADFSISSIVSLVSSAIGAVVGFTRGLFSKDKDHCIKCGACGEKIDCVVRRGEQCPKCHAVRRC